MKNEKITIAQTANKKSSGMCYAIHLSDGSFIIIDSGEADSDGDGIYDYNSTALLEHIRAVSTDEKPVISAWFITHFHYDHVDMASRLIKEQKDNFEIKMFAYNSYRGYEEIDPGSRDGSEWEEAMDCYPDAERHILKSGEVLNFSGVKVDVLMAEDFGYYADPPSQNHISAALMITFDNGRKFAVLGDCDTERLHHLTVEGSSVYRTAKELKCDVLQVPHHGLPLGTKEFIDKNMELYKIMDPEICFFPVDEVRFASDKKFFDNPFYSDNYYLLTTRRDKCFHNSKTTVVDVSDLSIVK